MSAKLLNAFADDNQEFHRQIGCMTGIFQLFDRQHLLTGRRLNGQSPKSLPSGAIRTELHARSPQVLDKNRSVNENHRFSMESARASFSSSSCSSSFSSLECNKPSVQEASLPERGSLESTFKCSPNLHSRVSSKTNHSAPNNFPVNSSSAQPGRESVDFRDVVKDSIYRESSGLSVKTSATENMKNEMKHRDSPRPLPLSKSKDGSYVVAINGKPRTPMNLDESLRVLAKLKEAPWYFSESMEPPRSSYEAKDGATFPLSKEAPRFSFDGREASRASMEYRENKAATKLRELPRLSLDSREGSLQISTINLRPPLLQKNESERSTSSPRPHQNLISQPESSLVKRPPNVVAILMGLEAMPNRNDTTADRPVGLANAVPQKESDISKGQRLNTIRLKPIKITDVNRQDQLPSPKLCVRELDTPKKANCQARIPIETAPWSQQVKGRNTTQIGLDYKEIRAVQRHESVYSEIERKLKDLEFQQSNKDLRALKQILDAIRAKGLLEPKKGAEQPSLISGQRTYGCHTGRLSRNSAEDGMIQKDIHDISTLIEGIPVSRPLESPIVIMKPATAFKCGISSPAGIPFDGPVGLPKVRTGDSIDNRRASVANQATKGRVTNNSHRESEILLSMPKERKSINKIDRSSLKSQPRTARDSPRHRTLPNENDESTTKTASSLSPRLQQRRLYEKQTRPSTSPRSNKQPRQPRQVSESVSPRGKIKGKIKSLPKDGHLTETTDVVRSASPYIEEVASLRSDSNASNGCHVDVDVTSGNPLPLLESPLSRAQKGPSIGAAFDTSFVKQSEQNMKENFSSTAVAHEQPSPVSVLDPSFYRDNSPASPVKCSSIFSEVSDQEPRVSDDIHIGEEWKTAGIVETSATVQPSSELSHKKLRDIEILVKKLRQLSQLNDKEDGCDHIGSLCETQNPDHRYVSEILLASGLLLKDFSSSSVGFGSIQLHKSGYPINPELFLVIEQKKSGRLTKPEDICEKAQDVPGPRTDKDRAHRKFIFDAVNELLVEKLELGDPGALPTSWLCLDRRVAQRNCSGQRLLKELCMEIDKLESNNSRCVLIESDDDDGITSILAQDIVHHAGGWTGYSKEVSGLVLDIERSIFKELIGEVLNGDNIPGMQAKSNRRRRQLFAK